MLNHKKTSATNRRSLFAIVDERLPRKCEERLYEEGFSVIKLPPHKKLPAAMSSHTDMLLFRAGDTLLGSREYFLDNPRVYEEITAALPNMKFILSDESQGDSYPDDAIFNALVIGNKLFAKCDTVSKTLLALAEKERLTPVNVKQGYPACTTLVLPRLAITADRGMERAISGEGIPTCLIEESERIELPPYKNGFIGGCAGCYRDTVYFIGNLDAHPQADVIRGALKGEGYRVVSLDESADSLLDLGGIIFAEAEENG